MVLDDDIGTLKVVNSTCSVPLAEYRPSTIANNKRSSYFLKNHDSYDNDNYDSN
jgi:hypothetical protein